MTFFQPWKRREFIGQVHSIWCHLNNGSRRWGLILNFIGIIPETPQRCENMKIFCWIWLHSASIGKFTWSPFFSKMKDIFLQYFQEPCFQNWRASFAMSDQIFILCQIRHCFEEISLSALKKTDWVMKIKLKYWICGNPQFYIQLVYTAPLCITLKIKIWVSNIWKHYLLSVPRLNLVTCV